MKTKTLATLCIVMAILLVIAVTTELFIDDYMRPSTLFASIVVSTLVSGVVSTIVVEKLNAAILE